MNFADIDMAYLDACIDKILEKGDKLEKLSFLRAPDWTANKLINKLTTKWNMVNNTMGNREITLCHY